MFWIDLIIGLVLMLLAWGVYRNPNLINPYGGMSPERKALVDIDNLKWVLAITMAVAGGLLIIAALLSAFKVIDETASGFVAMGICFAMLVPMFIAMHRYNGFGRDRTGQLKSDKTGRGASIAALVITGFSLVFVIVLLLFSNQTPKIEVGEENLSISGMYGRDIPLSEIVSVELLEKMPPVAIRTNGSSTGKANKGHFKLKNGEKCMMFISNKGPYIEIRTTDNLYYINSDTEEKTLEILSEIKAKAPLPSSVSNRGD